LNVEEYNISVNLRKVHPEYVEQLGSLSSSSSTIHKNDNLQKYLKKLSRKTLEENLLKKHNKNLSITSLLNMKVASFIDEKKVVKDICDITYYKRTVIILPEKTDKKYVIAVYLH
jgi:predicted transglutaminase-like protease